MSKRIRFIITSVVLSLGFVGIQFLENQYRIPGIATLGLLTVSLFIVSLREGLGLNMTLLTLVLPFFYTIGVGLFWFLLPANIFARVPIIFLYGIGIYALCLTSNIYTVAAIRTIALLRAARGVGFVLSLVTSFLIFDAILSLKNPLQIMAGLVYIASFPIFLQGFWTIPLEKQFSKEVFLMSAATSLVLAELSVILFFNHLLFSK